MTDTIIVGAGLSALIAARRLTDEGQDVILLEKSQGPGGRLATRWVDVPQGRAVMDHGAQFFTVRSPELARLIKDWPVHVWHHGPSTARSVLDDPSTAVPGGDGHPRYVGDDGMNGIAKHLAQGLDVRRGVRVSAVVGVQGGWQVASEHGSSLYAKRVLITAPVPQTLEMLPAGTVDGDVAAVAYEPCIGLLVATDVAPRRTAVQLEEGPVRYIADNQSKGISEAPSVTVHAHGDWSAAHYDHEDADLVDTLWVMVRPWVAPATTGHMQIKRWRYATPTVLHADRAVSPAHGLVLAGDAFGGAKVEGAALSGLAAADLLLA